MLTVNQLLSKIQELKNENKINGETRILISDDLIHQDMVIKEIETVLLNNEKELVLFY